MNSLSKMSVLQALPSIPMTVVDVGAGEAAYWQEILSNRPNLNLICVEPDRDVRMRSQTNLDLDQVKFLESMDVILNNSIDVVVCFSVLEHVWDLESVIQEISRILKIGGTAHLNYDDGHFRSWVYRDRSLLFRIRNQVKTLLGPFWKLIHKFSKFQKPVDRHDLEQIAQNTNLTIVESTYSVLDGFKKLDSLVLETERENFIQEVHWFESTLNYYLGDERILGEAKYRNHNVLWSVMSSRTLTLIKM